LIYKTNVLVSTDLRIEVHTVVSFVKVLQLYLEHIRKKMYFWLEREHTII